MYRRADRTEWWKGRVTSDPPPRYSGLFVTIPENGKGRILGKSIRKDRLAFLRGGD